MHSSSGKECAPAWSFVGQHSTTLPPLDKEREMTVPETVPMIDISGFTHGSIVQRENVVREIADACERIGFFLIEGHRVYDELLKQTYATSRAFFDLHKDEKLEVKRNRPEV